jgi:hypothetical protein
LAWQEYGKRVTLRGNIIPMPVSALSSNLQSAVQQIQLQQAERGVERARLNARSLQAQASSAQAAADSAQVEARAIASAASQAQSAAQQASLQLLSANSLRQVASQVSATLAQVLPKAAATQPEVVTTAAAPAVVNTQGQTIGTVVNTTA